MNVHLRFKTRTLSGAQELRLQMGHGLTGGNIVYGTGVLRGIRWNLFSLFPGMLFPFIQKLYLNPVPGFSIPPQQILRGLSNVLTGMPPKSSQRSFR